VQIEILALCDAATDYQGHLCVLGAFDTIYARTFPATHSQCAIANEDGRLILPPLDGKIAIALNRGFKSASANLIFGVQGLQLESVGDYEVNLAVDGKQEAAIPLYVRKPEE